MKTVKKLIWHSCLGNNFGQEYFRSMFMSYAWDRLKQVQAYKHGGFKHQIGSTSVGYSNDATGLGQFLDHFSFQGIERLYFCTRWNLIQSLCRNLHDRWTKPVVDFVTHEHNQQVI